MTKTYYVLGDYSIYGEENFYGIYDNRAAAEEIFFSICDDWVYEYMMTTDPVDYHGSEEWDWKKDYWWLMGDAARTLMIREVAYYYG